MKDRGGTHVSLNADSAYPFCIACDGKKGTLSQHFVTHVVPPLDEGPSNFNFNP